MDGGLLKVSCVLDGDTAMDFERLAMECKASQYAPTRQKQQAALIAAALLALDATKQKYTAECGVRYPSLVELLNFMGIPQNVTKNALGIVDGPTDAQISHVTEKVRKSRN